MSLQKAYPLCLSEISIIQYKVYASLSRLGYRVFRHKEPTPDKSNGFQAVERNTETIDTSIEEHTKIDQPVSMNMKQSDSETHSIVNNDDDNIEVIECSLETKDTTDSSTNNIVPKNIPESNESATIKAISENVKESTTIDNNIQNERDTDIMLDQNTIIVNDETSEQDKEKTSPTTEVTNNESMTNENVTISRMNIDDNANETIVTTNRDEDTVTDFIENATAAEDTPNTTTLGKKIAAIDAALFKWYIFHLIIHSIPFYS